MAQPKVSPLADDPLTEAVVGSWKGKGIAHGFDVRVTRRWGKVLGAQFLCAHMEESAQLAAYASSAIAYWRPRKDNRYQVVWLDHSGASLHEAEYDVGAQQWVLTLQTTDGAEQRLVMAFPSSNECTEKLQKRRQDTWQTIKRFVLRREPLHNQTAAE